MRFIVLLAVLISGCGNYADEPKRDFNPELRDLVFEYIDTIGVSDARVYNLTTVQLRSPVDSIHTGAYGICYHDNFTVQVFLDSVRLTQADRRHVLIHELSHCLLDLDHDESTKVLSADYTAGRTTISDEEIQDLYNEVRLVIKKQGVTK